MAASLGYSPAPIAPVKYSLIVSAKLNEMDPQAQLAYVFANTAQHTISRLDEFLQRNWRPRVKVTRKAA